MMSTRELFEMAAMDVLGLLDEEERKDFEVAFRTASPEVQAQIRREQRRAAEIEPWLPAVETPAGLRTRVLQAVRGAIASMSEPVATIGPAQNHSWLNSVTVWRAACIGFATASVILAGFFYVTSSQISSINTERQEQLALQHFQDKYAARFHSTIASPETRRVSFTTPMPSAGKLMAMLYIDPETGDAYLVGDNLPIASGEYSLVVAKDGNFKRLKKITGDGGEFFHVIPSLTPTDAANLAIVKPNTTGENETDIILRAGDNV